MVTITMLVLFSLLLVVALSMIMPMYSYALTLDKPIDCMLGQNCYIQNYVDLDKTGAHTDYMCGPLSYDGHKGTDFRLLNLVQMREGVNVLAAADGTVVNSRDEMEDASFRDIPKASIENRECGNGVLLKHKGGYQTQYCHMMKGSIAVKAGDDVRRGDVLGKVGLSGMTEFPHLHLEVRDRDGATIDPFSGIAANAVCGTSDEKKNIWNVNVRPEMAYIPTGILGTGFSSQIPSADAARDGKFNEKQLQPDAPSMIFWADLFGLRDGDVLDLRLIGPDNVVVVHYNDVIKGNKAQFFQFIGRHRREPLWLHGTYKARVSVIRSLDGKAQPVLEYDTRLEMERGDVSTEDFLKHLGEEPPR